MCSKKKKQFILSDEHSYFMELPDEQFHLFFAKNNIYFNEYKYLTKNYNRSPYSGRFNIKDCF